MEELKTFLSEEQYKKIIDLVHILTMPDPSKFVVLARQDGVKFIVHSNENCGHNRAHVHIECGDAEYVLSIPEADVIKASGNISKAKLRMAQDYIKDNDIFFAEGWNNYSNGIKIVLDN